MPGQGNNKTSKGGLHAAVERVSSEQHGERKVTEIRETDLPISNYKKLTVPEVANRLEHLPPADLQQILEYEQAHKNRKSLIAEITRKLSGG